MFGSVRNVTTRPDCNGTGKIIAINVPHATARATSSRKRIQVNIPAGIDDGQSIRIREKVSRCKRRTEMWPLVEVQVTRSSDLPETGYEHLLYRTDYICAGSARRWCEDQHRWRRRSLYRKTGNSDRYQDPSQGKAFHLSGTAMYAAITM